MKPLRDWSFARLALVCAAWVFGVLLLAALWLWWYFRPTVEYSGSAGIGAVSVGIAEALVELVLLAIPLVPPLALFIAWLIARRRR